MQHHVQLTKALLGYLNLLHHIAGGGIGGISTVGIYRHRQCLCSGSCGIFGSNASNSMPCNGRQIFLSTLASSLVMNINLVDMGMLMVVVGPP